MRIQLPGIFETPCGYSNEITRGMDSSWEAKLYIQSLKKNYDYDLAQKLVFMRCGLGILTLKSTHFHVINVLVQTLQSPTLNLFCHKKNGKNHPKK